MVTGASRGIGEAIALALAGEGCRLALVARSGNDLERVAQRCEGLGARALCLPADLREAPELKGIVERCVEELGALHILVNNAGVFHQGLAQEADLNELDEMLDVNLRAAMHLTRHALPHIIGNRQKQGAVIFIASMSGKRTYSGGAGYCATKFGMVGFADAVFRDVREHGIKVSVICPGFVNTPMVDGMGIDTSLMAQPGEVAELVRMVATWPGTSCPREILLEPQRLTS